MYKDNTAQKMNTSCIFTQSRALGFGDCKDLFFHQFFPPYALFSLPD